MNWQVQPSIFTTSVIIEGVGNGLFVYSPTAGLGNLIASVTGEAGTDGYGNTVLQGVTTYIPGVPTTATALLGGISLAQAANPEGSFVDGLFSLIYNGGAMELDGAPFHSTAGTITLPTIITTDTWHPVTPDTGWTTPFGGSAALSYTLGPDQTVRITGGGQFSSSFTSQAFNSAHPLPAAYWPKTAKRLASAGANASINVGITGVLTAVSAATGQDMFCEASYPLGI
jgi:hypothetical protein